jgi:hypothetical protein
LFHINIYGQQKENLKLQTDSIYKPKYKSNLILKTNPLSIVGGPIFTRIFWFPWPLTSNISITAEKSILNKHSIEGQLVFIYKLWNIIGYTEDSLEVVGDANGIGAQIRYKFYLQKKQPSLSGLYISPGIAYSVARFYNKNNRSDHFYMIKTKPDIILGFQATNKKRLTIDLYGGGGVRFYTYKTEQIGSLEEIFFWPHFPFWSTLASSTLGFKIGVKL